MQGGGAAYVQRSRRWRAERRQREVPSPPASPTLACHEQPRARGVGAQAVELLRVHEERAVGEGAAAVAHPAHEPRQHLARKAHLVEDDDRVALRPPLDKVGGRGSRDDLVELADEGRQRRRRLRPPRCLLSFRTRGTSAPFARGTVPSRACSSGTATRTGSGASPPGSAALS